MTGRKGVAARAEVVSGSTDGRLGFVLDAERCDEPHAQIITMQATPAARSTHLEIPRHAATGQSLAAPELTLATSG